MRLGWLPRTLLASLIVVAVCAGFRPPPVTADDETAADAHDSTITTTLYPGWNVVGWVGPETPASELFDELPALGRIFAWDAEEQRYLRLMPSSGSAGDPHLLAPGDGLWLYMGGTSPVEWTREASEGSVLLDLRSGPNLVAWGGRDGTTTEEAVARLGDRLELAWAWNAESQEYRLYHPSAGLDQVQALNHGDALLVELSSGGPWWQPGAAPPPVVFLGEIPDERREEIGALVDSVRAVFAERWAVQAQPTIYVGDRDSIAPTYRRIYGHEPPGSCGESGGRIIFIKLFCVGEGSISHEYFHALQHNLSAGSGRGPTWIIEGSAEYAKHVYASVSDPTVGVRTRLDGRKEQDAVRLIRYELPSLDEIEGHSEFHALPDIIGYRLGLLAVDWLVEQSSERSVVSFFEALPRSGRWQDAFEGAFGIAVDDFYHEFDGYLARIAPPLPHLTDTSDEPVLEFLGDPPAETRVAVRAEFEAVRNYFALELEAGTADYTLYVGTDQESLVDTYVRVSGTQPPSRVCSWLPYSGSAIINPDCHAAPHRLNEVHFIAVRELLAPWLSLPPVPDGFDRRGPLWLRYGAELYISAVYRAARGYEELQTSWDRRSSRARQTARLLESMSTWEGIGTNNDFSRGTALGSLAIEWLADRAGDPAIFEYYRLLPDSESWEEAFEAAFGIAVDDFYEQFEAYRAEVAPPNEDADAS